MSMCTLSLKLGLPTPRLRAFFAAWSEANEASIRQLSIQARLTAKALPPQGKDLNRKDFLAATVGSWLASAGELCISDARGCWPEPTHQDGGASVLHMGTTVFGRRRLTCQQDGRGEDILLDNVPGSVYLGGLTGPTHGVVHQSSPADELLYGKWSVSLMQRTTLFPQCRSRGRNVTPHPPKFFYTLAASVRESLRTFRWALPSLQQCLQHLSIEASRPMLTLPPQWISQTPGAKVLVDTPSSKVSGGNSLRIRMKTKVSGRRATAKAKDAGIPRTSKGVARKTAKDAGIPRASKRVVRKTAKANKVGIRLKSSVAAKVATAKNKATPPMKMARK